MLVGAVSVVAVVVLHSGAGNAGDECRDSVDTETVKYCSKKECSRGTLDVEWIVVHDCH